MVLFVQKLETAETRVILQTLKWTVVSVLVLAVIYFTLFGRLLHVAAIIILLVLLLRKDIRGWFHKPPSPLPLPKPLTRKEAARILKVNEKATPAEIEEAFLELKAKDSTERDLFEQARNKLLSKK